MLYNDMVRAQSLLSPECASNIVIAQLLAMLLLLPLLQFLSCFRNVPKFKTPSSQHKSSTHTHTNTPKLASLSGCSQADSFGLVLCAAHAEFHPHRISVPHRPSVSAVVVLHLSVSRSSAIIVVVRRSCRRCVLLCKRDA